jgi:hypothetical protein
VCSCDALLADGTRFYCQAVPTAACNASSSMRNRQLWSSCRCGRKENTMERIGRAEESKN